VDGKPRVILLPGAVLPAAAAYRELVAVLGDDALAVPKELELYAGDRPPVDYSLDDEVNGVWLSKLSAVNMRASKASRRNSSCPPSFGSNCDRASNRHRRHRALRRPGWRSDPKGSRRC